MERCIKRKENVLKDKNVKLLKIGNKKFIELKCQYLIATPCMHQLKIIIRLTQCTCYIKI